MYTGILNIVIYHVAWKSNYMIVVVYVTDHNITIYLYGRTWAEPKCFEKDNLSVNANLLINGTTNLELTYKLSFSY